jgi:hypothetical protein
VYEGVFDRFPKLQVVLPELGWSWAVPFAWRMDHAYRVMGREAWRRTAPARGRDLLMRPADLMVEYGQWAPAPGADSGQR